MVWSCSGSPIFDDVETNNLWRRASALGATARRRVAQRRFTGSADYWERRYLMGGNSGVGSYGDFATFKAELLNAFVVQHRIQSVIEFGCGDGHQLSLADYPRYVGLDVAPSAIEMCAKRFAEDPTKSFFLYSPRDFVGQERTFKAELALSLDVLFHLVEDDIFDTYLRQLFDTASRHVVIYSSNEEVRDRAAHVRHRKFTSWVESNIHSWHLVEETPNPFKGQKGGVASFFTYARN